MRIVGSKRSDMGELLGLHQLGYSARQDINAPSGDGNTINFLGDDKDMSLQ